MKIAHAAALLLSSLLLSAPSFSAPSKNDKQFEACKHKLQSAQKLKVLYAFDWKPPKAPYVVAGPTFFDMPIDAKEGFAETVSCFLTAGDKSTLESFDILDWRTGKKVARFSSGKLRME